MADYRLSAKVIGRSDGRSSVAAAAYRAGQQLHDERTDLSHDYPRKRGVLHSEILAPDNAPDWMKDRAKLWNAVEKIENRKDSQLAREIQLSLPHELDEAENRNLLLEFVQTHFVDHGMIADVAMHAPDRSGDQRNIHAHVMLTMRVLTGDGFGKKNRDWNTPEQLAEWRKAWAEHQNKRFQALGMEQRVDHRSYDEQGIDREPTQHLGAVANDMERQGKASRIGDENRERQKRNVQREQTAREAAELAQQLLDHSVRQQQNLSAQKQAQRADEIRQQAERDAAVAAFEEQHGEQRNLLELQRQRLEQQLQADGWRKLMRDLIGKTRRDEIRLEQTRCDLQAIAAQEVERRAVLDAKHREERQRQNQQALNRSQTPAHAREQDNALPAREFKKAATRSPVAAQDAAQQPDKQAEKERVLQELRRQRDERNSKRGLERG